MALSIVLAVLGGISIVLLLVLLLRGSGNESINADLARFEERFQSLNSSLLKTEQAIRDEAKQNRDEIAQALKNLSDSSSKQMIGMTQLNEQKLENIRQSVEKNLKSIQEDNSQRLEQMRATVDEKLQSTLEKRLGESFTQVSERLESVYKGLGEMQKLASEVGNLKGVLSNIKTRGTLGEIQLEKILEQILSPEQYEKDANILGKNKVEFAIKLPGKDDGAVLLPVDSKLPLTEYERLCSAQEQADKELVKSCGDSLEAAVKLQARDIKDKYIQPPRTTDFAIMFLPIEGLYAEVLRRPGLFDSMQSQYKVLVAGPSTFAALLNSLQMGFKTLAVEKRATEVWKLLAVVKAGMGKFMVELAKTKSHLDDAYSSIDRAEKETGSMNKKLKDVQSLPAPESEKMFGAADEEENSES
jgi:DNA recombination protein RmuC